MTTPEMAAYVERAVIGLSIWVGIVYLLSTATPAHFEAVLGFSGPLIGAVVSFFFRINGQASNNQEVDRRVQALSNVPAEPAPVHPSA